MRAQIAKDVADNKVVVFMKGVPDRPQCGFSKTVTQILKAEGVPFTGFNVLADADLRNGVKTYSNWPTIPQGACTVLLPFLRLVSRTSAFARPPQSTLTANSSAAATR